jgi:hypothetical protein
MALAFELPGLADMLRSLGQQPRDGARVNDTVRLVGQGRRGGKVYPAPAGVQSVRLGARLLPGSLLLIVVVQDERGHQAGEAGEGAGAAEETAA